MKKHLDKSKKKIIQQIKKDEQETEVSQTGTDKKTTREKQIAKRSFPLALLIQGIKTLFMRIPLFIVILTAIILGGLKLYMTPEWVEKMAVSSFNKESHGTLDMKVKKFSPFGGFVIQNIIIRNGPEFGKTKFITIDRLVFRYRFFRLFTGSVRFPEIGIYNPRVYLAERNGLWNAARLMKPREKKKEEEKEEEKPEETGPGAEEISLPISVDFLFKFVLKDLRIYVNSPDFKSKMEGLSLNTEIVVPPCKTIPLSPKAVSLIKTLKVELNPDEKMNVSYQSKEAGTEPPLVLTWKLIFNNQEKEKPVFNSIFKFGSYNAPVRFRRTYLAPLNFLLSYNLYYDPLKDFLILNHLKVNFKNKTWIHLGGTISGVTQNPYISLDMRPGRITLGDIYPYFVSFTGNRRLRFRGDISLYPMSIRGTGDNLTAAGSITGSSLYVNTTGAETIIPRMKLKYNFSKKGASLNGTTDLQIPRFTYTLKGSKSADTGFSLTARVASYNNNARAELQAMKLRLYNPALKRNALAIDMKGFANLKGDLKGKVTISRMLFDKAPLLAMVPHRLKKNLKKIPLKKPASLTMTAGFNMGKTVTGVTARLAARVPDFNLNDLRLSADVAQYPVKKKVLLKHLTINSKSYNGRLSAKGWLDLAKQPFADSRIDINLSADFPEPKKIYEDVTIQGLVKLTAAMRGSIETGKAKGKILCNNLNLSSQAKKFHLKDLSLDFPFVFPFRAAAKKESLIAVNKSQLIDNDAFREKPNFTIKLLAFKHLNRNEKIEYMKDFQAHIGFDGNIFEISNLKAYVLDGSLYSRQILFNMADRKRKNMEYRFLLDLTNVDVARLDTYSTQKRRDAELSLNANFSGTGLNFKKGINADGYVNIHKIGEKFARRLMVALSNQKGKSTLGGLTQFVVDNAMSVKAFNFRLSKGLVYTTVDFTEGPLSRVATIKKNKVSFERIPIHEYLKKIQEEE